MRLGLAQLCENVLSKRFTRVFAVIESDMQLLSMLLILCRDDAVEVQQVATQVSSVILLHYIFYISYYQMVSFHFFCLLLYMHIYIHTCTGAVHSGRVVGEGWIESDYDQRGE